MTTLSFYVAVMETTQRAMLHHVGIPSGCCKGLLTVILFEEALEKHSGVPKGIFYGKRWTKHHFVYKCTECM